MSYDLGIVFDKVSERSERNPWKGLNIILHSVGVLQKHREAPLWGAKLI
jgi:hypothetical protein